MTARAPVLWCPALLFCPGDRPDRFGKAAAAGDTVVLDLEDAVAPGAQGTSPRRGHPGRAPTRPRPDRRAGQRHGNALAHDDDIAALMELPSTVVMLPMASDVAAIEALAPRPVVALCETAAGVLAAPALATAGNCAGLMWGSEDLIADLGGRPGRTSSGTYLPAVEEARTRILYAAQAAGVMPIDTVPVSALAEDA
jgi:citrate lyase subunit beta/citryl-CoA lyase